MNQTDARNFLVALNSIVGYVPPMLMHAVTSNPICRILEHVANTPPTGEQQGEQPPQRNGRDIDAVNTAQAL